jgi:CRISPR type I-E-associated protein CasB/Cse2
MRNREWSRLDRALVARLQKMADPKAPDRAGLACLRRGLTSPVYALARVGWLFEQYPDGALDDAILGAALFAWAKGKCANARGKDYGAAFGEGLTRKQKESRKKRFIALLDSDKADLPDKLRNAVSQFARDQVDLDWTLLIHHLRNWNSPNRPVQRQWARGFWADEGQPDAETTTAESPTPNA